MQVARYVHSGALPFQTIDNKRGHKSSHLFCEALQEISQCAPLTTLIYNVLSKKKHFKIHLLPPARFRMLLVSAVPRQPTLEEHWRLSDEQFVRTGGQSQGQRKEALRSLYK